MYWGFEDFGVLGIRGFWDYGVGEFGDLVWGVWV